MPSQSLASIKPSNTNNGPYHTTSLAHAKPTSGPFQPTCCTASTAALWQHLPRFSLHRCGEEKAKKATKDGPLHEQDVEDC
ncbi:hypothetical protein COP2_047862 [Malus domestica]